MCGIVGYWPRNSGTVDAVSRMADRIATRGPDDAGVWADGEDEPILAHRRLSILYLTPAGHQPMVSPCGRYVFSYNGEIHKDTELREELEHEGG